MPAARSAPTALVLVDHGSRSVDANEVIERAARDLALQCADRFVAVLPAHMEIASPSLADALEAAVAAGAEVVVVGLFFLGPGRHSREDVPAQIVRAQGGHPAVRFVVSEPLGPDARLTGLALARAEEALAVVLRGK